MYSFTDFTKKHKVCMNKLSTTIDGGLGVCDLTVNESDLDDFCK